MTTHSRISVYLHIGTNKTGTSAIQNFCNANRHSLSSAGLLYPETGCSGEAHYIFSDVLGFCYKPESRDKRLSKIHTLRETLSNEINLSNANILTFSSENFVLDGNPIEVAHFFENYKVYIVIYLRRHDSWLPSTYNQAVKQVKSPPWGSNFEQYLDFHDKNARLFGNYRRLIDRWAKVFGKESIIVRPYEARQNKPHIVADFFNTIGRQDLAPPEVPRTNESLNAWSLGIIDIAQRAKIDDAVRQEIIDYTIKNQTGGERLKIASTLLRELVARHQLDYEYIAREYLGREDGQLFYDPLPSGTAMSSKIEYTPWEIMAWTTRALMGKQEQLSEIVGNAQAKIENSP